MTHLQRHIVWEVCKVFGICLLITMVLMTVGTAAKEGARRGLPPQLIVKVLPYTIPEILRFTVPGCLLFSVCAVVGRMSANNELLAVRTSGIATARVVWPVLLLAWLLSLGTFTLYDVCASWSRPGLHDLLVSSIDEIACEAIRAGRSFQGEGIAVYARLGKGNVLKDAVVTYTPSSGQSVELTAREAELVPGSRGRRLQVICRDSEIQVDNGVTVSLPGRTVHEVELDLPQRKAGARRSPAEIPASDLSGEAARLGALLREAEVGSPARSKKMLAAMRARWYRLRAEPQRRVANGFTTLCFAVIGVPVAVWRRSTDTMSVFFLCFGPILLIYYPLLVIGETAARAGYFPHLSVWLANSVLLALGGVLWYRIVWR